MTPKELVKQIFNDNNRDCHYRNIIYKVMAIFPNMTDEESGECEDYAESLLNEKVAEAERDNRYHFHNGGDFEQNCQETAIDLASPNKFLQDELYERFVESDVFIKLHAQHGGHFDYGGEDFDGFDSDSDMTYSEQCHADRSDYASQFSDPIQRAEIRAGA